MTREQVEIKKLVDARSYLVKTVNESLTLEDRKFLVGLKEGHPDLDYAGKAGIMEFPAVKWKMHNLDRINMSERQVWADELKRFFGL
jgi:hypothetical protein